VIPVRFVVRCSDCLAENSRPKYWREACADCAESVAESHRTLGHSVTVMPIREAQ
jgi:hypothetical protein